MDEIERVYRSKAKLIEDWSWVYEPLIPEVMFTDYGYDAVPDPEAFRIAIVPHHGRGLDADLLMYDHETGEVSDKYATSASGGGTGRATESDETTPTVNETEPDGEDDPEPTNEDDGSENDEERSLAEARAIAGPEEESEPEKDETPDGGRRWGMGRRVRLSRTTIKKTPTRVTAAAASTRSKPTLRSSIQRFPQDRPRKFRWDMVRLF